MLQNITNSQIILLYLSLTIISVILLIDTVFNRNMSGRFISICSFLYIMTIGWLICQILFHTFTYEFAVRYVYNIKLIFISFLVLSVFTAVSSLYYLDKKLPGKLYIILTVIPVLTAAVAVTSPMHTLLDEQTLYLSFEPFTSLQTVRGIWFKVHTVYCQGLILFTALMTFINYRNLPRSHRLGSGFLLMMFIVYITGTTVQTFFITSYIIDLNLVSAALSVFFFHLAAISNRRGEPMNIDTREILNYIDDGIVILSEKGIVLDMNAAAGKLFGVNDLPEKTFEDFLKSLESEEKIARRKALGAPENEEDLYFISNKYPVIYHVRSAEITGSSNVTGRIVILTNVTNNRLYGERIIESAGIDILTGLPNRFGYYKLLKEFDDGKHLPLSIVVGDVNGLKKVNDLYGHIEGDALLKSAANTLQEFLPYNGHLARVGGDEFIMILPEFSEDKAKLLISDIQKYMRHNEADNSGGLSIALGSATKTAIDENINALINEADLRMYNDKREGKQR